MYGTILLHEGTGGYVTGGGHFLYCGSCDYRILYQIQEKRTTRVRDGNGKDINDGRTKVNEKTKRTDLCVTALHLFDAFFGFCACIGGGNETGGRYAAARRDCFRAGRPVCTYADSGWNGRSFHAGGFDFCTGKQYEWYD